MSRNLKTLVAAAALIGGLLAAPALYADGTAGMMGGMMQGRQGDMMGQGGMMRSMMSGMMNMMGMSGDMGSMTEHCNAMMQVMDGQPPNDQWRTPQPERPGQRQG